MNILFSSMLLATASAAIVQAAEQPTLKAGSEVRLDALASAKWIQGEGPASFEADKVYIFECWATWCGPCIKVIPHVNALHKKYAEKGLRIYGMNVWEDNEEKVRKFVKDKGDGMSYPVAFTGKGSKFEQDWLKAGGVRGIPSAFVLKNGKLLIITHPSRITDQFVEALLAGDESALKATADGEAQNKERSATAMLLSDFRKATAEKDFEKMEEILAKLETNSAAAAYLPALKLDLLIAKNEWPAAIKSIEDLPEGPSSRMSLTMAASKIGMDDSGNYPEDFINAVGKSYSRMLGDTASSSNSMGLLTLASLQWRGGDKETALATAKIAARPKPANEGRAIPTAPFERFAKSMEEGKLPSMREFSGWLRESMPKPAAPSAPLGLAEEAKDAGSKGAEGNKQD